MSLEPELRVITGYQVALLALAGKLLTLVASLSTVTSASTLSSRSTKPLPISFCHLIRNLTAPPELSTVKSGAILRLTGKS